MCPQVMDDLHIDHTTQSLLNLALHSSTLSLPTLIKNSLYLPLGHHHFFPSQSYTLGERGMCLQLSLVPSKVSPSSAGLLGQSCAGADQGCLEGEALGAAVGQMVGCRTETGLTPMLVVFRCCGAGGHLYQSFFGEQRFSGVQESPGEVG